MKEELLNYLKSLKASTNDIDTESNLFITAGAGDIDTMVEPIKNILIQKSRANNYV